MALSSWLLLLLMHPLEFKTLLQYYIYHKPKRDLSAKQEHLTSGWDRASMRRCWELLDMSSRSFVAVVKELEGDLARVICIFYLVLRALDTVEDDMTLPASLKQPLLRNFHIHSQTPGWTFTGSGPNEKDRQVLVEYDIVIAELQSLVPAYRDAILMVAEKMGRGMADMVARSESSNSDEKKTVAPWLETIADCDLYCHYVAGLVGEGLSLIFAASSKESPLLATQLELSNDMGLLLQKTNVTRDFREDVDEGRYFWPREIWGDRERYGGGFATMEEMRVSSPSSSTEKRALYVLSAQILEALRHAPSALNYLRLLKSQSVFNFVAIPATMAIATLELCFMNPRVFKENVKIRKAVAVDLIMRSTNPRSVGLIFVEYARRIHARADPADPNFIRLSVACGKIEQWYEHNYPSCVRISSSGSASIDLADARGVAFLASEKAEQVRCGKLHAEGGGGRREATVDEGAWMGLAMRALVVGMVGAVGYSALQIWH